MALPVPIRTIAAPAGLNPPHYMKLVAAARAAVQLLLWTILLKAGLVLGGLQAAAVQALVNG